MPQGMQETAWRYVDGVVLALTTLIGVIAWIAACVGVNASDSVSDDTAWLNLSVAGFVVFGAGNALWLLRGRRAVGSKRVSLVRWAAPSECREPSPSAPSAPSARVMLVSGGLIHESGCPLVSGKPVVPAKHADGLPCGVCSS